MREISDPQAQKENVSRVEYLKNLDVEIRRLKERINRRKAELAKVNKETHRANVSPSNQKFNSTTNRDVGMRVGEQPKGTVSESCIKGNISNVLTAEVPSSKYSSESCTRKDCSSVAEIECSLKISNAKDTMPKIDKAKIVSKISRELITKKQEFSFDHKIFSELCFRESIPVVRQCLICVIFHRWLYKIKKFSKCSVKRINKISQDKISDNFLNLVYHRW